MSVIQEPGSTRPGRAAGLVLLGVAVIAAVLGVITLIDGNESSPPTGTPAPTTSRQQPPSQQPPGSQQPPASQPGSQPPPPPVTTTTTGEAQPPPPPDVRKVPVRVFNNGTITGFANQAARDFRADGWNVVEVGNYSQGIIPTTTAYFRAGTEEEPAARELARKFSMRAEPRFAGILGAQPGLIVIITNDYGGK